MNQPLYQFISWVARKYDLLPLLQPYEGKVLAAIALLALGCCFFGFYCYRGMMSGLVLGCIALVGGLWVRPLWGAQAAATFGAVLGVALGFLAFRWYRFGAVTITGVIAGSWIYPALLGAKLPTAVVIVATILLCSAAGAFTFFFPLWGVCGFTAFWGGLTFAAEGWRLIPSMGGMQTPVRILLGMGLAVAGLAFQLWRYRKQMLFKKIMPQKMAYSLEKRKRR